MQPETITRFTIGLFTALFLLGAGLSGCNTIEGMGEDVEAVGETIDEEAEET